MSFFVPFAPLALGPLVPHRPALLGTVINRRRKFCFRSNREPGSGSGICIEQCAWLLQGYPVHRAEILVQVWYRRSISDVMSNMCSVLCYSWRTMWLPRKHPSSNFPPKSKPSKSLRQTKNSLPVLHAGFLCYIVLHPLLASRSKRSAAVVQLKSYLILDILLLSRQHSLVLCRLKRGVDCKRSQVQSLLD
jgi:hypothetical protein